MPETTTKPSELEELQEQARGTVQIRQSEAMTMAGHIRSKLRLGRRRLEKTWQDAKQLPEGDDAAEADDDMQILARDITFNAAPKEAAALPAPAPTSTNTTTTTTKSGSRWPMAAALALGLGVPATTGIVMAPSIIDAFKPPAPTIVKPASRPDYVPILLPGKPQGVK